MKAEEFSAAKEILTTRASYKSVLESLAKVKSDETHLREVHIRSKTKDNKDTVFGIKLEKLPTVIREKVTTIFKDAHVAFEATVAHRIKTEIAKLNEEFSKIPCTQKK